MVAASPRNAAVAPFLVWASRLRFPWLLAITATLFVVDLFVPDLVPFVDEVILGLLTILLASVKRKRNA